MKVHFCSWKEIEINWVTRKGQSELGPLHGNLWQLYCPALYLIISHCGLSSLSVLLEEFAEMVTLSCSIFFRCFRQEVPIFRSVWMVLKTALYDTVLLADVKSEIYCTAAMLPVSKSGVKCVTSIILVTHLRQDFLHEASYVIWHLSLGLSVTRVWLIDFHLPLTTGTALQWLDGVEKTFLFLCLCLCGPVSVHLIQWNIICLAKFCQKTTQ